MTAWADGPTSPTLLRDGPLEPAEALALVGEIADAVAAAHAQGIAHLALDPTNVVVGAGADVTVLGLAVDAVLLGHGAGDAEPGAARRARSRRAALRLPDRALALADARRGRDADHGLPAAPRVGAPPRARRARCAPRSRAPSTRSAVARSATTPARLAHPPTPPPLARRGRARSSRTGAAAARSDRGPVAATAAEHTPDEPIYRRRRASRPRDPHRRRAARRARRRRPDGVRALVVGTRTGCGASPCAPRRPRGRGRRACRRRWSTPIARPAASAATPP